MKQIFCPPRRFHYIYYFRRKTIFVDGMCEVDGGRKIIAIPKKGEEKGKFQSHALHRLPLNAFVYKQQASLTKGSGKVSFACAKIYVIALRLEKWLQKNLNIQKRECVFVECVGCSCSDWWVGSVPLNWIEKPWKSCKSLFNTVYRALW